MQVWLDPLVRDRRVLELWPDAARRRSAAGGGAGPGVVGAVARPAVAAVAWPGRSIWCWRWRRWLVGARRRSARRLAGRDRSRQRRPTARWCWPWGHRRIGTVTGGAGGSAARALPGGHRSSARPRSWGSRSWSRDRRTWPSPAIWRGWPRACAASWSSAAGRPRPPGCPGSRCWSRWPIRGTWRGCAQLTAENDELRERVLVLEEERDEPASRPSGRSGGTPSATSAGWRAARPRPSWRWPERDRALERARAAERALADAEAALRRRSMEVAALEPGAGVTGGSGKRRRQQRATTRHERNAAGAQRLGTDGAVPNPRTHT